MWGQFLYKTATMTKNEQVMMVLELILYFMLHRMQVLGATNYSHWGGHDGLQECLRTDPQVANELLEFAKDRIRSFTHIGTTDQLYPSIESAAASLGLPLDGPAYSGGEVRRAVNPSCCSCS
jgi:xylose isomerase